MSTADWFQPGTAVRVIGGKYNGFEGHILWCGGSTCSITVTFEGKQHQLSPIGLNEVSPLSEWRKGKTDTELTIRGAS